MSFIAFLIAIFILVLVHELGHFIAAKLNNVKVEEFGIGFPPRIAGIKYGETLYSLNLIPLGGFVRVYGEEETVKTQKNRAFIFKKPHQKLQILLAGIIGNFLLGWLLISYLFTQGVPVPTKTIRIEKVEKNSPAEKSSLQRGDIIKAIKYKNQLIKLDSTNKLVSEVKKLAGKEITLIIKRDNKEFQVKITPRKNPPKGEGALGIVISSYQIKKYSPIKAPFLGLYESFKITGRIISAVGQMFINLLFFKTASLNVTGPIGIAKLTSEAARHGVNAFLEFLAILSLNLAVINLIPFPALDGGRIIIVLYEWKRKKTLDKDFERKLTLIGFAILLLIAIIISIYDIRRFF